MGRGIMVEDERVDVIEDHEPKELITEHPVCASFPWLARLPSHLLARLDWAEIQVPTGLVADVVRQLEAATGQLVMTYHRHRDHRRLDGTVQLCQMIEVAQLSPADATVLVDLERTVPDVSIVLYGNPLRLRQSYASGIDRYLSNRRR